MTVGSALQFVKIREKRHGRLSAAHGARAYGGSLLGVFDTALYSPGK